MLSAFQDRDKWLHNVVGPGFFGHARQGRLLTTTLTASLLHVDMVSDSGRESVSRPTTRAPSVTASMLGDTFSDTASIMTGVTRAPTTPAECEQVVLLHSNMEAFPMGGEAPVLMLDYSWFTWADIPATKHFRHTPPPPPVFYFRLHPVKVRSA